MIQATRRNLLRGGLAAALPLPALAQAEPWPSRPVRIVVPYAPGGQGDITGRLLADQLTQRLGKSFFVENRAGANGVIGTDIVAKARPDGLTIGVVVASHVLQRALMPNLPYDPVADFVPVTMPARTQMVMVCTPGLPVRSVAEFVAHAKARPGQLAYKSAGAGSNSHLFGAWFCEATGIEMTHVPYRGSGDSMNHLVSGLVHLGFDTLPAVQDLIVNGQLRLLAAGGPDRSPQFPDVPTVAEAGVAGFAANSWSMVLAPKDTPAAIIDRMNAEMVAVLRLPALVERFTRMGAVPMANSPAEALALLRAEEAQYAALIARLGIVLG
ncbi:MULTISPECIES: Bug family tripartite tricarboxylate transporter substrate binding protein [Roseomonadaceae]|uniref:Tripartite tricarboxylate transporter substrate binding protein n=1 Tax=Falsiroseomonas oleicola TaxID=2801474 RepID=A0ABS6H997_9PROT|nr:tripartite tricarboxylate transporter substrate binding protein [Roseomonas oleicola]MBU8544543.1 tripartite tricarboxylate transporter substrate binding protein [Roseomonas oleicola]